MAGPLFDRDLRKLRRDRAERMRSDLFLVERAFEDTLDRLEDVHRTFTAALLIGCPHPDWPARLAAHARTVTVVEPGERYAAAVGAICAEEDALPFQPGSFDLCLTIGTLETAADLQHSLRAIRSCLKPDSLFIGAIGGNGSLPALRSAMLAADKAVEQGAAPHVHPQIDPPTLAALLTNSGFTMPVLDVDRVEVRYRSLRPLVRDLRSMSATNLLCARPRHGLMRAALKAAEQRFGELGDGQRTSELFDIVHFAAWTPQGRANEHAY